MAALFNRESLDERCEQPPVGESSRRAFLKRAGVVGAAIAMPTIVPAHVLGRDGVAPSEKVTLGVVGIGPRCTYVLGGMLPHKDLQCVAIADVQQSRRDKGKKLVDDHYGNRDLKLYRDFREVLDRNDVDAVLIATGDRWHAPASMLAAKAGKDVYSEKPCGLTIGLCQELADTIESEGRIFQAGTQRRSVANFHEAVRLVHEGKLGKLKKLYASVYVPEIKTKWLPSQPTPDPKICDWNMWLGPAPWRPYNKTYVDGGWRGYYDFDSGGKLLDWGAHTVDLCQWANQSDDTVPTKYEPHEKGITAHYENGVVLEIDFLKTPFRERPGWIQHLGTCPVRYVGEDGWVEVGDSGGIEVSSADLKKLLKPLPKKGSGLDVNAHSRNWLDCIKSRELANANHKVMRRSHTACHAAAIAWMLNRPLELDPVKEEFVNDNEANGLRHRSARDWA